MCLPKGWYWYVGLVAALAKTATFTNGKDKGVGLPANAEHPPLITLRHVSQWVERASPAPRRAAPPPPDLPRMI
ncbi:hypothetical protein NL676_017579 [Syzygium grande]|nr:hypothetical protein NL676_017579 [Syzygium grande]